MTEKPDLLSVTCVCIHTGEKANLGARAVQKSLECCNFGAAKMLTDDMSLPHAVRIPPITSLDEYSRFVIRDLHRYVDTPHCLIVQWDGWPVNAAAWTNSFLDFDFIGAPWVHTGGVVGNGGFSLRSKRFLETCSKLAPAEFPHPEDSWVSYRHRTTLEALGMKFAPTNLAARFAFEGRKYSGVHWSGDGRQNPGSFGFHSFLSPLPPEVDAPLVAHHSGDAGDVIYSLAVVKALGGAAYFLSPDCKWPFPKAPKLCAGDVVDSVNNIGPLAKKQDYCWSMQATMTTPQSAELDFNRFRQAYQRGGLQNWMSLLALHGMPFGVDFPRDAIVEPWLECDEPVVVPDRPIVVSNTGRYFNAEFPWWGVCRKYGSQMLFVGTPHEHSLFQALVPDIPIPHHRTANLWEVARVIQGAKEFIGNQSAPMAIALGLGVNLIQCTWPSNPNCKLLGPNRIFWEHGMGDITIPEGWLE